MDNEWTKDENGDLCINWATLKIVPESILRELKCQCKKVCTPETCECIMNRFECTIKCHTFTCQNYIDNEEMDLFANTSDENDSNDDDFYYGIFHCYYFKFSEHIIVKCPVIKIFYYF